MVFIETPLFTKQIKDLLMDEEYRALQNVLIDNPDKGDVIQGGGGVRKIRHAQKNQGKSGGIRAIYYWISDADQIVMLIAYPKSKMDNLSPTQVQMLKTLVKEQFS